MEQKLKEITDSLPEAVLGFSHSYASVITHCATELKSDGTSYRLEVGGRVYRPVSWTLPADKEKLKTRADGTKVTEAGGWAQLPGDGKACALTMQVDNKAWDRAKVLAEVSDADYASGSKFAVGPYTWNPWSDISARELRALLEAKAETRAQYICWMVPDKAADSKEVYTTDDMLFAVKLRTPGKAAQLKVLCIPGRVMRVFELVAWTMRIDFTEEEKKNALVADPNKREHLYLSNKAHRMDCERKFAGKKYPTDFVLELSKPIADSAIARAINLYPIHVLYTLIQSPKTVLWYKEGLIASPFLNWRTALKGFAPTDEKSQASLITIKGVNFLGRAVEFKTDCKLEANEADYAEKKIDVVRSVKRLGYVCRFDRAESVVHAALREAKEGHLLAEFTVVVGELLKRLQNAARPVPLITLLASEMEEGFKSFFADAVCKDPFWAPHFTTALKSNAALAEKYAPHLPKAASPAANAEAASASASAPVSATVAMAVVPVSNGEKRKADSEQVADEAVQKAKKPKTKKIVEEEIPGNQLEDPVAAAMHETGQSEMQLFGRLNKVEEHLKAIDEKMPDYMSRPGYNRHYDPKSQINEVAKRVDRDMDELKAKNQAFAVLFDNIESSVKELTSVKKYIDETRPAQHVAELISENVSLKETVAKIQAEMKAMADVVNLLKKRHNDHFAGVPMIP